MIARQVASACGMWHTARGAWLAIDGKWPVLKIKILILFLTLLYCTYIRAILVFAIFHLLLAVCCFNISVVKAHCCCCCCCFDSLRWFEIPHHFSLPFNFNIFRFGAFPYKSRMPTWSPHHPSTLLQPTYICIAFCAHVVVQHYEHWKTENRKLLLKPL